MGNNTELYAQDFYVWCLTTAALIREGKWYDIDPEALAEEIESVGHQDKRELESRLGSLLVHLLTWWACPEKRCGQWKSTIRQERREVALLLRDSPSLQTALPAILSEEYPLARAKALAETRLSRLPIRCPFTPQEVVAETFWPEDMMLAPQDAPRESSA
jgi:Domain of unknown function DUF29